MKLRTVAKTVRGRETRDGAGVKLTRVLGYFTVKDFDPFLMLDAIDSTEAEDYISGFPPHPHRGIETVTYLLEGRMDHQDSLGNRGTINSGECQWMTAGSGVIHSEMPRRSRRMLGFQLWVNLPAKDKMTAPAYRSLSAGSIPAIDEDGVLVRVLSGYYKGKYGAMQADYVKTDYLDVEMKPGRELLLRTPEENTAFIYIIEGELATREDGAFLPEREAILFSPGEGISLYSGVRGARFMFLSAKPLRERVEWGGPIVMNTEEELRQAFNELDEGVFIKHAPLGMV